LTKQVFCFIIYLILEKGEWLNLKQKSSQSYYPYQTILDNGIIKLDDGYIKIIKVYPINYELKSNLEKEAILNNYKLFLKTCNFNFQILIQSKKENLSNYISNLKINTNGNEKIARLSNDYLAYISALEQENKSSSKEFFIILKVGFNEHHKNEEENLAQNELLDQFYKIKETLSRCGNMVQQIESAKETEEFLKDFYG